MKAVPPALAEEVRELVEVLHQAEGMPEVLAALQAKRSGTIDGAWGSSSTLSAALLAQHCPGTLLVVLAHPRDVDWWMSDLLTYTAAAPLFFPAWDNPQSEAFDNDASSIQRLRLLRLLQAATPPAIVLSTIQAILQPVPNRQQADESRRMLSVSATLDLEEISDWLIHHGYNRKEVVERPGEFGRRGGIFDVFSPDAEHPVRVELFGDEIESLRSFDPGTQRTLASIREADILSLRKGTAEATAGTDWTGHLSDYLPAQSWVVLVELEDLHTQGREYLSRLGDTRGLFTVEGAFSQLIRHPNVRLSVFPTPSVEATCHLRVESIERFSGDVARVREELDSVGANDQVLIVCPTEAETRRLLNVLAAGQLAQSQRLRLVTGQVKAGFRLIERGRVVLGSHELFHREESRQILPRRKLESRAIDSFLDLSVDDLVVHISHGIARYRGMQIMDRDGRQEEFLTLEFRDGVRVYVPASRIDLVQQYVGGGKADPELSKFGGTSWGKKKEKVQQAVLDLASEMLELQALREAQPGIACPIDSEWQAEFEASFPYQETPDQLTTIAELKSDMERPRPMDRLICGDVGYGKTELAIRAAFKAADNGRQVAVLVPTTVLAEQHYRTFSTRMANYPFSIEVISRFRTSTEQKKILAQAAKGHVDILIGTHRLLSADVQFKDLGLVIIDEEQRFGVDHKERLKRLRSKVDVLTMTATPIPRTLHLSLLGIRDISNLETPPVDRFAIETRIQLYDKTLIRHAIVRELNREGQVYFVHNRVQDIHAVADRVQQIVPEASVVVGHGQMSADELEAAMLKFVRREADILVATTIIESGLDIPNANTIFINEADRYGLADLHQLRGRVGRYRHRAYAYLLLQPGRQITGDAARRLKAIEEFTELGAGFKIALRDLEIRGAGNILGTQQSGHIAAIGYELYCQMLENAVQSLKKLPVKTPLEMNLDVPWQAFLPREYVASQRVRIEIYRRLARIRTLNALEDFESELRDRFGPLPEPTHWLLRQAEIRILAVRWAIANIHLDRPSVSSPAFDLVFSYRHRKKIEQLAQLSQGRLRVVDDQSAYFRINPQEAQTPQLYALFKQLFTAAQ